MKPCFDGNSHVNEPGKTRQNTVKQTLRYFYEKRAKSPLSRP